MKVITSDWFKYEQYPTLQAGFKLKLQDFLQHAADDDLDGLKGRNKRSDDADPNNHNFMQNTQYAHDNELWHYHLGLPKFETSKYGDLTSDWILHYQRFDTYIKIIQIAKHPFKFPDEHMYEHVNTMGMNDIIFPRGLTREQRRAFRKQALLEK